MLNVSGFETHPNKACKLCVKPLSIEVYPPLLVRMLPGVAQSTRLVKSCMIVIIGLWLSRRSCYLDTDLLIASMCRADTRGTEHVSERGESVVVWAIKSKINC
jgi:hypothetical protein